MPITSFKELNLSNNILKAIHDLKFTTPTPIQEKAIPYLLDNQDLIGKAKTGTGKTAGFGIPILEKIDPDSNSTQVLIICPTRELVSQVVSDLQQLGKYFQNLEIIPIFGGSDYTKQLRDLKRNPQIIVGTPGRLLDHIGRGTIKPKTIQTVVLDEADRMLDMGFRDDMESILSKLPDDRQTIMFSATMSDTMIRLMKEYQNNPVLVEIESKKEEKQNIEQFYISVSERDKFPAFMQIVEFLDVDYGIIFCNTKVKVEEVVSELRNNNLSSEALHGDYSQNQREKVLKLFKDKKTKFLVATDVAGRGIDVTDLNYVFNFDFPQDTEDYIHRIGRTGRAGKKGQAFSFISAKQIHKTKKLESQFKVKILPYKIPTIDDIKLQREVQLKEVIIEKLKTRKPKTHSVLHSDEILDFEPEEVMNAIYELWIESKWNSKPLVNIVQQKDEGMYKRNHDDRDRGSRRGFSRGRNGSSSSSSSSSSSDNEKFFKRRRATTRNK